MPLTISRPKPRHARQRIWPFAGRPLRVATFLAPHLYWFYEFLIQYLSRQLHRRMELIPGSDYAQLEEIDLAFVCSLPYVEYEEHLEPLAAPVLTGERFANRPIYFSEVVVAADSDVRSFADLRGRSWAYNEKHSQSGYGIMRDHLLRLGATQGFFGEIIEAGWHEAALHLVAAGDVDSAAVDCHLLATYLRQHPSLGTKLRQVATLGPSPIQPVVATKRLSPRVKRDFQAALLQLHNDAAVRPILAWAQVDRFVAADERSYDPIRAMRIAAEQADFLDVR